MFTIKTIIKKLILSLSFLSIGFIFFCFYEQWIIIASPLHTESLIEESKQTYQKKIITLFYYNQEKLHKEQVELVIPSNLIEKINTIINAWLLLNEEENIINKKITIDTITIAQQTKTCIISFNENPFNKEQSIYQKLLFIEGLLTTLRQLNSGINSIYFLVQQELLKDYHLDFSQSWPLEGFIE